MRASKGGEVQIYTAAALVQLLTRAECSLRDIYFPPGSVHLDCFAAMIMGQKTVHPLPPPFFLPTFFAHGVFGVNFASLCNSFDSARRLDGFNCMGL